MIVYTEIVPLKRLHLEHHVVFQGAREKRHLSARLLEISTWMLDAHGLLTTVVESVLIIHSRDLADFYIKKS